VTGTATAEEQETLMPCLVPPRTPLTPEQVERAFAYLMALEAGGGANVAGREDPELAFLMLRLTDDLVLPVTTVPGDEDPTADFGFLDRDGRCRRNVGRPRDARSAAEDRAPLYRLRVTFLGLVLASGVPCSYRPFDVQRSPTSNAPR